MRAALVLVLVMVTACGKSDAPAPAPAPSPASAPVAAAKAAVAAIDPGKQAACEQTRDKYLAWQADRVKSALGGEPPDQKAALQAEADKEATQAKDRFVDACIAMGDALDASCFEHKGYDPDRAHKKHCDDVVHALEAKLFAR
ncbi:MAG: hypothetical protein ACM31C_22455 [Acidobacteriota bacterium]